MIIEKRFKILRAAAPSWYKVVNCHVLCSGDRAYATNGAILAVVPALLEDSDLPGLVSRKALEEARRVSGKEKELNMVLSEDQQVVGGDVSFKRPQEKGEFPDIRKELNRVKGSEEEFCVTLDPEMLLRLADALGSRDEVTLSFKKGLVTIEVIPPDNDGMTFGLFSPKRQAVKSA